MSMLKPLFDRVVVERLDDEEVVGGIVIPDTAKEKPQKGRVISVGPGRVNDSGTLIPPSVKKGDVVYFGKYSGTEIKFEGNEWLVMREDDIFALVK